MDRHIQAGVSQPTDDPSHHRTYTVRAPTRLPAEGWLASARKRTAISSPAGRNEERSRVMTAQAPSAARLAAYRRTAEALTKDTILPAFATLHEEFHRPAQQRYVTIRSDTPTSAVLTIATAPPEAGEPLGVAGGLRYGLALAFDAQTIAVKRTVNGTTGGFLGQWFVRSLTQQAIVDDVRRLWRRAAMTETARR
jgi:hypothetical protein